MKFKQNPGIFIRNFIFGVEDSLVSTVGLISGVAIADMSRSNILLIGAVLVFVEAFSMAVGSLMSEHSVEEYVNHKDVPFWNSASGALIMFFAYFIFGFVPLSPYVFTPIKYAFWISIVFSLVALFFLGFLTSKISGAKVLRNGLEMLALGGAAIVIGVVVGKLASPIF